MKRRGAERDTPTRRLARARDRLARWRWRVVTFAASCVVYALPVSIASARPTGDDAARLAMGAAALGALDVELAEQIARELVARHEGDAAVDELAGMVALHRGRYDEAATRLALARDRGRADARPRLTELSRLAERTRDATRGFVSARDASGRYVVAHAPGRDAELVPYALEAMRAADDAISRLLGARVPGPIRLEVYPDAASLAMVSTLTEADIARTGTIALCKWDRLMITSPWALVYGYPWLDTVAHEFVHLVLARATRDRAPVWLQEGVAKFLERTWRGEPPSPGLEPATRALLASAVARDALLSFDRLHPSIARLPSQEDAALAFAQVATFIASYDAAHGDGALRDALRLVAEGTDARDALAGAAHATWADLERHWRRSLRSFAHDVPHGPGAPVLLPRRLRGDGAPATEGARARHAGPRPEEDLTEGARRASRLGDLLFDRGRPRAAADAYARAHALAPDDPFLVSRFGRAALLGGVPTRARQPLERALERHPEHAPLRALFASVALANEEVSLARGHAIEAIRLNPFDPEPHCVLSRAAEDTDARTREAATCRRLGGSPP